MDLYYKMCKAAGLTYYRKVPNLDDLKQLYQKSGIPTIWFNEDMELYSLAANMTYLFSTCNKRLSTKEIALIMIMSETRGLGFDGKEWITERELIKNIRNGKCNR